ncbi:hypothetical protein BS17DRAFT_783592 [Gyrodon lividus]|nr:hypothetical protein BS17DRAFT_783592 [Gyrodon lividus]
MAASSLPIPREPYFKLRHLPVRVWTCTAVAIILLGVLQGVRDTENREQPDIMMELMEGIIFTES